MNPLVIFSILSVIIFPSAVTGIEPITTGAGLFAAGSMVWMAKDKVLCHFRECCQEPYIRSNLGGFQQALDDHLFGQHIAKSVVFKTLQSHLRKYEPKKALVLSFHGMTGAGKNYLSQLIAENLFTEGTNSKYVHIFLSTVHFPDKDRVEYYKNYLQNVIKEKVSACPRTLFIFDEIDDLDPGIIDAIKPFLDYHPVIDGVDYRKAIFLFLSNTGASKIYSVTKERWESGHARESLTLDDFDEALNSIAYNTEGGLRRTDIIEKALIDAAIPFLPLEKKHVKMCIKAEMDKQNKRDKDEKEEFSRPPKTYTEEDVSTLADMRTYDKGGIFSKMGCKKLETLVAAFMEED